MPFFKRKSFWFTAAALLVLTLAVFFPINLAKIALHDVSDYPTHLDHALDIEEQFNQWRQISSHPLWHFTVVAVRNIFQVRMWKAAFMVQMGLQVILAGVLLVSFWQVLQPKSSWAAVPISLAVMVAAPVALFAFQDSRFYYGYLGINSYHNPTIIALKPFSLILTTFGVQALSEKRAARPALMIWGCAAMVVISSLVKPNFTIIFIPALGLLALVQLIRKKAVNWDVLVVGFALPALAILAVQFLFTYQGDASSIIFAPLLVARNFSGQLLPKFILSIWFPVLVLIFYGKQALKDRKIQLAGLAFLFGAAFTFLLAESGERMLHGNFTWSGEIGNFVLFAAAAEFFFRQLASSNNRKKWWTILSLGFAPHGIAGVLYYTFSLTHNSFM